MQLVEAAAADADLLGEMNQGLRRDQGSVDATSVADLAERMRGFLQSGWTVLLFKDAGVTLGYAMFRPEDDGIYLFGFYIAPEGRRGGLGREALQALIDGPWKGAARVRLDVRISNPAGHAFWQAMGFTDQTWRMERRLPPAAPEG